MKVLSDYQRNVLSEVYAENDYPRDKIPAHPDALLGFTYEFNRRAMTTISPDRMASILLNKDGKHKGVCRLKSRKYTGPKFTSPQYKGVDGG